MKTLIFILILIQFIIQNIQSVATIQQKQKYLNKLIDIHKKLQSSITQLKKTNQNTIRTAQSLKGQNTLQKLVLEQGVNIQRDLINKVLNQSVLPLKQNYWTCKDLTPSQKFFIQQKITNLKQKSQQINKQIFNEPDCLRNIQLKDQLMLIRLHIESLENQLISDVCLQTTRKDNYLINNLKTDKGWIYDNMAIKDYQMELEALKTKYNLIQCPLDKPFIFNNTTFRECSKCALDTQIFNLAKNSCIQKCPNGTIFSKENHQCLTSTNKVKTSNFDISNTTVPYIWGNTNQTQYLASVQALKKSNLSQPCPVDKPLTIGYQCVKCPDLYDISTKSCLSCANGEKYVALDHTCKLIIKSPNYELAKNWITPTGDSSLIDNKIKSLQSSNYPIQKCPIQAFYPSKDLKTCLLCNKYYDLTTYECKDCGLNQIMKNHKCVFNNGNCSNITFWNGIKCLNCVVPGYFDKIMLKCVCPNDTQYVEATGECKKNGIVTNVTTNATNNTSTNTSSPSTKNNNQKASINYIGTLPPINISLLSCSQTQPFFNKLTSQCISCSLPDSFYDFSQNKCKKCQTNKIFNITTKKCQIVVQIKNSNIASNITNYCCGQPKIDLSKPNCPLSSPYFDGTNCIACERQYQYFNLTQSKCLKCPNSQIFYAQTKTCVKQQYLKPLFQSYISKNLSNYYGKLPQIKPLIIGQQVKTCPLEYRYSINGKQCVKCELPKYFNFQSNLCEICKQGYSFETIIRQCVKDTVTNGTYLNSNLVNAENFNGILPQFKAKYPVCNQTYRYFNGKQCIKCQLPKYFDFNSLQCKFCDQTLYFNVQARKCFYPQSVYKYYTNMQADKIFYNGHFEQLKNRTIKYNLQACPKQNPYFDKTLNKCVSCGSENNIFNIIKNQCIKCNQNMHFNQIYHICTVNSVQPTLQRMIMNSGGWF